MCVLVFLAELFQINTFFLTLDFVLSHIKFLGLHYENLSIVRGGNFKLSCFSQSGVDFIISDVKYCMMISGTFGDIGRVVHVPSVVHSARRTCKWTVH